MVAYRSDISIRSGAGSVMLIQMNLQLSCHHKPLCSSFPYHLCHHWGICQRFFLSKPWRFRCGASHSHDAISVSSTVHETTTYGIYPCDAVPEQPSRPQRHCNVQCIFRAMLPMGEECCVGNYGGTRLLYTVYVGAARCMGYVCVMDCRVGRLYQLQWLQLCNKDVGLPAAGCVADIVPLLRGLNGLTANLARW